MLNPTSQIHRFHDTIAIFIGKGETMARAADIASALLKTTKDVETVKFTKSTLETFNFEGEGKS